MEQTKLNRLAVVMLAASFLSQTTGAADLAGLMSSPVWRVPPRPAAFARLPSRAPAVVPPSEPWLLRLAETAPARAVLDALEAARLLDEEMRVGGDPSIPPDAAHARQTELYERRLRLPGVLQPVVSVFGFGRVVVAMVRVNPARRRVTGEWIQRPGFRFRVNFLDSLGDTWADAAGMHAFIPYFGGDDMPAELAPRYHRLYATYIGGQKAAYEVEIENTGSVPLRELRVWANAEAFDETGARGTALVPPAPPSTFADCVCVALHKALSATVFGVPGSSYAPSRVTVLPPGGRVVLDRSFLVSTGTKKMNLEQIHLLVTAASPGRPDTVLADEPQAGIAD